jgi:hypothetical protein
MVAGQIGGDAIEPADEARFIAQAGQGLPGFEKGFLGQFVAYFVIADHARQVQADRFVAAAEQGFQGAGVSLLCLGDQSSGGRSAWVG